MTLINLKSAFMAGVYFVHFSSPEEVERFVDKYRNCPVWTVVHQTKGPNEVFILAIELKRQQHGDFSQENNTLVRHPEYLGAESVSFHRNDDLLSVMGDYSIQTAVTDTPPCGSDCETCASFNSPCRGCPAVYEF